VNTTSMKTIQILQAGADQTASTIIIIPLEQTGQTPQTVQTQPIGLMFNRLTDRGVQEAYKDIGTAQTAQTAQTEQLSSTTILTTLSGPSQDGTITPSTSHATSQTNHTVFNPGTPMTIMCRPTPTSMEPTP